MAFRPILVLTLPPGAIITEPDLGEGVVLRSAFITSPCLFWGRHRVGDIPSVLASKPVVTASSFVQHASLVALGSSCFANRARAWYKPYMFEGILILVSTAFVFGSALADHL